jgi:hypothetical protein
MRLSSPPLHCSAAAAAKETDGISSSSHRRALAHLQIDVFFLLFFFSYKKAYFFLYQPISSRPKVNPLLSLLLLRR